LIFETIFFCISFVAGAVASIAGFGIGSILTPFLATRLSTKIAVAVVSIPHLFATSIRLFRLRRSLDKDIFIHFGLMSALGGLLGSLLHTSLQSRFLAVVLGMLLIFAGASQLFGFSERMRFSKRTQWVAGILSGFFGGLVGNQGGIRSAALVGNMSRDAFVATATGAALLVDLARMPVYFIKEFSEITRLWPIVTLGTLGAVFGTVVGTRLLKRIPEDTFKKIVAILIVALGIFMLFKAES
jgi:hypothetical protein